MAVTINGSDTAAGDLGVGFTSAEGLILTGQGSSNDVTIKNDADGTVAVIPTGTTNFGFDSGFGSAGVAYGVRAWIQLNGTGTIAIKASGNVSSITDNGTGDYTVTFTTNMPDANYSYQLATSEQSGATGGNGINASDPSAITVSSIRMKVDQITTAIDAQSVSVTIFR